MKQFRVRFLAEAAEALRMGFLHVLGESGQRRAEAWLSEINASVDLLETAPRASQNEGEFCGRELRSKLVMSHRVFFTIDEPSRTVYVIDVIHTSYQPKLDEYRPR